MDRNTYIIPAITAAVVSLAVTGATIGASLNAELMRREPGDMRAQQPTQDGRGMMQTDRPPMDQQGFRGGMMLQPFTLPSARPDALPAQGQDGRGVAQPGEQGMRMMNPTQLQKMIAQIQKAIDGLPAKQAAQEKRIQTLATSKTTRWKTICDKQQASLASRINKATDDGAKAILQQQASDAQSQCDDRLAAIQDQADQQIAMLGDRFDDQRSQLEDQLSNLQDQLDAASSASAASAQ